jgi:tubulin-like protein CetZ
MVGFDVAGARMADAFASIKNKDGTGVYNCYALFSNDADLMSLTHIPTSNCISLSLGGIGKRFENALQIINENEKAKERLKNFISQRIKPADNLVLFFADLGGGNGVATIIKAIEEFNDFYGKPIIREEFEKIQQNIPSDEIRKNLKKYQFEAVKKADEKRVKIGIVVTLPAKGISSAEDLRNVVNYCKRIWDLANKKSNGIAFVIFADNQKFYEDFKQLPSCEKQLLGIDNYRDFGIIQIRNLLHELNTATAGGGTSITFSKADLKRILLEYEGCLVINKVTRNIEAIYNEFEMKDMIMDSLNGSLLHEPIEQVMPIAITKVHHIGFLPIISSKKILSSSFMDYSLHSIGKLFIFESIFRGYLIEKNINENIVYTLFKTKSLPKRVKSGLAEEYSELIKKQSKNIYMKSEIEQINNEMGENEINSNKFNYFDYFD